MTDRHAKRDAEQVATVPHGEVYSASREEVERHVGGRRVQHAGELAAEEELAVEEMGGDRQALNTTSLLTRSTTSFRARS